MEQSEWGKIVRCERKLWEQLLLSSQICSINSSLSNSLTINIVGADIIRP